MSVCPLSCSCQRIPVGVRAQIDPVFFFSLVVLLQVAVPAVFLGCADARAKELGSIQQQGQQSKRGQEKMKRFLRVHLFE